MPLYLATSSGAGIARAITEGRIGRMSTPHSGNTVEQGALWAADSGAFTRGFDAARYTAWLRTFDAEQRARCCFAPAGDVVGDWTATLALARPFLPTIRALRFPAAIVLQDGAATDTVPWDELDAVFVGGTDAFKLGPAALELMQEARARGKWVHMGRVNSGRRFAYATHAGCDSVDGTFLSFGPDINLARLLTWEAHRQPSLFRSGA